MFGAQSCLKAVQDQSDGDVSAAMLGGTQLLGDRLHLCRNIIIWTHQQYRAAYINAHKHTRKCLARTEISAMFNSFNRSFFKYFHSHSVIITFFVDLHGFRAVNLMGNTLLRPYQSLK